MSILYIKEILIFLYALLSTASNYRIAIFINLIIIIVLEKITIDVVMDIDIMAYKEYKSFD